MALNAGRGSTWWAPGALGWWVGALFAVGAAFFALGAMPGYVKLVGNGVDALTFFIGSIPFTTAALLQYLQAVNAHRAPSGLRADGPFRVLTGEPRGIDWWAAAVQFIGTLFFNASTFYAMYANLSATQADKLVWRPDIYGSTCFLIASLLAWVGVAHGLWSWQPHSLSFWIAALNMLGAIGFGFSAVAAFVVPTTGEPINVMLVNLGTFIGALCFLTAGLLLLPARTRANGG